MTDKYNCASCAWFEADTRTCNMTPPETLPSKVSEERYIDWPDKQWCSHWHGGKRDEIFAARMRNVRRNIEVAGRDTHAESMEDFNKRMEKFTEMITFMMGRAVTPSGRTVLSEYKQLKEKESVTKEKK